MFVTGKYHLTSRAQLACLNYLESDFLMPSIGAIMEPLPDTIRHHYWLTQQPAYKPGLLFQIWAGHRYKVDMHFMKQNRFNPTDGRLL